MKQENKDLVFMYMSMALPYRVKILHEGWDYDRDCEFSSVETLIGINDRFILTLWRGKKDEHSIQEPLSIVDYKPFLRPMLSMTEEEIEEFRHFKDYLQESECKIHIANYNQIQWLLEKHFDFMELIPKGLAIKVTKENNPYKITEE
jgi:hypothetical protein